MGNHFTALDAPSAKRFKQCTPISIMQLNHGIGETTMTKLKPCPFCNCEMNIHKGWLAVHPDNGCVLGIIPVEFNIKNEVWVNAWNNRVEDDKQVGE